jgi:hypothetical protein
MLKLEKKLEKNGDKVLKEKHGMHYIVIKNIKKGKNE